MSSATSRAWRSSTLHSEKTYEGVIRFGFATDTYDADGEPTTPPQDVQINCAEVRALAAQFQGSIEQMPPPFSAKKIAGVPAYKLARKKQEVALKPVQVEIKEFEILDTTADQATFRARVASGTYIRSVAHEMGQKLGCGAHLASLRRTAVAEFAIEDAHSLAALETAMQQGIAESLFHLSIPESWCRSCRASPPMKKAPPSSAAAAP